ncbi:MAG: aminotransferase class III-fold pyridoxal phosphate-dependent enzyme, partial [Sphingobacteriaceae bacterium]
LPVVYFSFLAGAAALAAFDYMEENHTLAHVTQAAEFIQKRLNDMKDRLAFIGDVRGKGLLWGVELVKNHAMKEKATRLAELTLYKCLELGLSLKVSDGNVICLYPPLVSSIDELDDALNILEQAMVYANSDSRAE